MAEAVDQITASVNDARETAEAGLADEYQLTDLVGALRILLGREFSHAEVYRCGRDTQQIRQSGRADYYTLSR